LQSFPRASVANHSFRVNIEGSLNLFAILREDPLGNERECLFICYNTLLSPANCKRRTGKHVTVRSKMSIIKPVIVIPGPEKILCPICNEPTYSRGGIHPQCAMEQADEARVTLLRNARRADDKRGRPIPQVHKKRCPECDSYSDAQREVCWCGFHFSVGQRVNRQTP
jgi:hypothetical protein